MDHNKIFKKYVRGLVDELAVREADGYQLFFKALPDIEKRQLLCLYFESIDRDMTEILESLGGNEKWDVNNSFLCDLIEVLQCNNDESKNKLIDTMLFNMQDYFNTVIQCAIHVACNDRLSDEKLNND